MQNSRYCWEWNKSVCWWKDYDGFDNVECNDDTMILFDQGWYCLIKHCMKNFGLYIDEAPHRCTDWSAETVPPRYTKCSVCFRLLVPSLIFIVCASRPMHCTAVLEPPTTSPNLPLVNWTPFTSCWSSPSLFASRLRSSANRRFDRRVPDTLTPDSQLSSANAD